MFSRRPPPPAPSVRDSLVREDVVVTLNTIEDEGYRGMLWAADDSGLLLISSVTAPVLHYVAGEDEPEVVDGGRMFVPDAMVKAVQIVALGADFEAASVVED